GAWRPWPHWCLRCRRSANRQSTSSAANPEALNSPRNQRRQPDSARLRWRASVAKPPADRPTYAHPAMPAAAGAAPKADVAVVAWHGMGQQIALETIEMIVRGVAYRQRDKSPDNPQPVVTRMVQFGDQKLWRAELRVGDTLVHVYEVYWAPLTAGKIKLGETISFLARAGLSGLWYCLVEPFRRHVFGRWETYPVSWRTAIELACVLLTILAMVVMNFAIASIASMSLF